MARFTEEELLAIIVSAEKSLHRNGFNTEIDVADASGIYAGASELWQRLPAPETEALWVRAGLIYEVVLATVQDWEKIAGLELYAHTFFPSPDVRGGYALLLTNGAVAGCLSKRPCPDLARKAVTIFDTLRDSKLNRWQATAYVAEVSYIVEQFPGATKRAVGLARKAAILLQRAEPNSLLLAYVHAVINQTSRVIGRPAPFTQEDIFHYQ